MRTLGALLYLFAAGLLAVLWVRGYLTDAIGKIAGDLTSPPAKNPVQFATGAGGGRVLRK